MRRKQPQPRPLPPQEPPGRGMPPRKDARPQQGGGRSALEAEIEEFLSRAQGTKQPERPEKRSPPPPEEPKVRPRTLVPQRAETRAELRNREAELGRGVAEHVRDHIQSAPISEHAKQLGRAVGQADEKLETRLHGVFDHQLGNLSKQSTQEAPAEGTDAQIWESSVDQRERSEAAQRDRVADIVEMLRHPASLQQAVILSEILRRPE